MRLDAAMVREALAAAVPMPSLGSVIDVSRAIAAAVVVPLRLSPEPRVVLVLRAAHLKDHAAEVGFPGGKPEAADADLEATALREMDEEVGVPAADVEILGALVPVPVITGRYLIHPFVGVLAAGAAPRAASAEIARVLELPLLPFLTGERRIAAIHGTWNGAAVFAPHFAADGCVLYGASAYILYELLARLASRLGRTLPAAEVQTELPWGDRYAG